MVIVVGDVAAPHWWLHARTFARRAPVALALTLALTACAGTDAEVEADDVVPVESATPVAPVIPPTAAPAVPSPEPLNAEAQALIALGVLLTDGFSPHDHMRDADGLIDWPANNEDVPSLFGDPPVPEGLGPLAVRSEIRRWPISCIEWHRVVLGADVGTGSAAARIEAEIARVAEETRERFLSSYGVEADCDDVDPTSATGVGDSYQELAEEPCAIPGGPRVRCFVLADHGYPPGAAHTYLYHHQLVFDVATGQRLSLEQIIAPAGLDLEAMTDVVNEVVAAIAGRWDVTLRQARPTEDGIVFGFSPYEAGSFADYTQDLFIPWDAFPAIVGGVV